jgi:hypothetical protein
MLNAFHQNAQKSLQLGDNRVFGHSSRPEGMPTGYSRPLIGHLSREVSDGAFYLSRAGRAAMTLAGLTAATSVRRRFYRESCQNRARHSWKAYGRPFRASLARAPLDSCGRAR